MPEAISIIRDEHRSIAAVLHGLLHLVDAIEAGTMEPDFELLGAMMNYIEAFPERLHHPKEDSHLFRTLRQRDPETVALLDELETEHIKGRGLLVELAAALAHFRELGHPALEPFARALRSYASFHWDHMRKEEDLVLPRAATILSADDWKAIDDAFRSNSDPLVGVEARQEFRDLFRRIVHLAPSPLGVGRART